MRILVHKTGPLAFKIIQIAHDWNDRIKHYSDVIMGAIIYQITSVSIVYSAVCSDADQKKYQRSASLAFARGILRWPVKGSDTWNKFPFGDVIMVFKTAKPSSPMPYVCCCCKTAEFNTLRLRQNGRHFPDDILKCIFSNENVSISITISLEFVPRGPMNNIPALVQIMPWHRPGDKPLSEPMMVRLLTRICVTRPQWVNTN